MSAIIILTLTSTSAQQLRSFALFIISAGFRFGKWRNAITDDRWHQHELIKNLCDMAP